MRQTSETASRSSDSPPKDGKRRGFMRAIGLGVVTGAADDDCSAIGTYASAGAQFGTSLLWTAPVTLPMMFAVVYLSSKLGQVTGKGLFHVIKENYSGWILWPILIAVLIGNTIEAAADLGGMAAALNLLIPLPIPLIVIGVAAIILSLQIWGSYKLIRNVFRWLALVLFAYIGAAVLSRPDPWDVLRGTFVPTIEFSREFLFILVAIIGTSLSAYLYTWQSNVEVEEEIAQGRTRLEQREGATEAELRQSRIDILIGMLFSNLIMYFIILSTGATLHKAGEKNIETAAQAAEALRPLAGDAAGILFTLGIVAVGFLAVPIMTTGAAYDLCQVLGWKSSLHSKPQNAGKFYGLIVAFTVIAVVMNFLGFNPMKALVYSGIVQGFSTPPLLLFILLMTGSRRLMGDKANGASLKALGWTTVAAIFSASAGLVVSWFL
ncbi:Nramp family divalent metal transporter [Bradyrhizobium sp. BWA-3-5]|uniref:Nramp family divalent metal transporter n=1 Tax=Bradyrhizobium sp. BWA-3-5 TaxID=3080013 RepID=UPI00293E724A|nr:Nramp family divalent metal transporter [Bradyrhizobium sp. BWA-3-5]WOH69124.1 Nramp family divalent metal transporter [Bradyrhizobium sp. BWA-3-5]